MTRREPIWRRYQRFFGADPKADVDDELRFHLEEAERGFRARGMDAASARRAAREQFGDVERTRRDLGHRSARTHRRAERTEWWRGLGQDVRIAGRKMVAQPGLTLAVVATLALGIGANAAVFSVVSAALVRPLPYPNADRLVVPESDLKGRPFAISPPDFFDYARQTHSFSAIAAVLTNTVTLTGHGDPQPIEAAYVTQQFFDAMGVQPALGRPFSAQEETYGQTDAVIISDGLWRSAFGGRSDIVDQSVQLDGTSYRVVGVMPPDFGYPDGRGLWTPLAFSAKDLATQRGAHYLDAIARLRTGVTVDAAARDLADVGKRLAAEYPNSNGDYTATAIPLRDAIVGPDSRQSLLVLLGAVLLVALIACANVANLLLARGAARARETAVRTALGARTRDLVRLALVESLMLALVGGGVGVLVAAAGTRTLDALRPASLRVLGQAHVDAGVLLFTLALSAVTGLLFGAAPAMQAARVSRVHALLRGGGRGGTIDRGGWRVRSTLVAAELALAVILLAGAGLLLKSFARLQGVDPGFRAAGVMTYELSLPGARYPKPAQAAQFYDRFSGEMASLPGVETVGAISGLPLDGYSYSISTHAIDGQVIPSAAQPSDQIRIVAPGTFGALGVRVLAGRDFSAQDRGGAPRVVIVNQAAAKLLWKGVNPLTHTVTISTTFGLDTTRAGGEVVGVVADVHDRGLGVPGRPTIYFPYGQVPIQDMVVVARVKPGLSPERLTAGVRSRLRALDPDLPLLSERSLESIAGSSIAIQRFALVLLGAFAALALVLAAVGIFGVMAFVVGQRTREIGVRMALGAGGGTVIGETLRRALPPVSAGVLAGVGGALLLTQSITSLLYTVPPRDPTTLFAVALALAVLAFISAWLPARRASRVDPVIALRSE